MKSSVRYSIFIIVVIFLLINLSSIYSVNSYALRQKALKDEKEEDVSKQSDISLISTLKDEATITMDHTISSENSQNIKTIENKSSDTPHIQSKNIEKTIEVLPNKNSSKTVNSESQNHDTINKFKSLHSGESKNHVTILQKENVQEKLKDLSKKTVLVDTLTEKKTENIENVNESQTEEQIETSGMRLPPQSFIMISITIQFLLIIFFV